MISLMQPHRSDPELLVLHTLRCCGVTTVDRVSEILALITAVDVESVLLDLAVQDLVRHGSTGFGGWGVTDAGRDADAERVAAELEVADARASLQAAYDEFVPLNQRTLDICGAWQVRRYEQPMLLNDHTDKAYDGAVLERLAAVDDEVQPVCGNLAQCLHRFAHYGPRLTSALRRAQQGEVGLVTDTLDSYHTVWFQLHEDLLVTLGINRWS